MNGLCIFFVRIVEDDSISTMFEFVSSICSISIDWELEVSMYCELTCALSLGMFLLLLSDRFAMSDRWFLLD